MVCGYEKILNVLFIHKNKNVISVYLIGRKTFGIKNRDNPTKQGDRRSKNKSIEIENGQTLYQ